MGLLSNQQKICFSYWRDSVGAQAGKQLSLKEMVIKIYQGISYTLPYTTVSLPKKRRYFAHNDVYYTTNS